MEIRQSIKLSDASSVLDSVKIITVKLQSSVWYPLKFKPGTFYAHCHIASPHEYRI